jgi:EpsI family protein
VLSERVAVGALVALMAVVGAAAWWLQLRPALHADYAPLASLPATIGAWSGTDEPLDTKVEEMLAADFNLQRTYRMPGRDELVWLYLGYYGTGRGGRPEHLPAECYPSAGWSIEQSRVIEIDPDLDFRANEFVVSQRGQRRLVHFWYRSARKTGMVDELGLGLDHLAGKLRGGRADGALVRLSTRIETAGADAARARLIAFARRLDPLLAERWPREFRAGAR